MRLVLILTVLCSFNAFACWNVNGSLEVEDNKIVLNQKIDHDKIYSFPSKDLIYNLKISPGKSKKTYRIEIGVVEKVGVSLNQVASGMMLVKENQEAILEETDNKTGKRSIFKMTVKEI